MLSLVAHRLRARWNGARDVVALSDLPDRDDGSELDEQEIEHRKHADGADENPHFHPARLIRADGEVEVRPMMYLALSYDHRLVDGEKSVRFLVRMKELLEDPARLMLEV